MLKNLSFLPGIKIETLIPMFNGFIAMVLASLPCSFFVTCLALSVSAVP